MRNKNISQNQNQGEWDRKRMSRVRKIKVGALLRLEVGKSLSQFNCPKQDEFHEYRSIFTFH